MWNFSDFNTLNTVQKTLLLDQANQMLMCLSAEDRITWGLQYLPFQIVLSSSFGIQSVVTLHLVTRQFSNIPVILIDTGYLFPETYRYIDQLAEYMQLNLQVFSPVQSSAWQEARYGKLWEQGLEGINRYNYMNKVEPMNRAFQNLRVGAWFAGLRRTQSAMREQLQIFFIQKCVFKLLPILDWDDRQVFQYIKKHALMRHPLWGKGYISLGDVHTTKKYQMGGSKEETRFFGLKRECGLHEEIF